MWTQGLLLASQDKISDIPNFSKNNSKVINVLSDIYTYTLPTVEPTQQPDAGIREHKAMQVPQAAFLEILTLANKDSSVGSAKLPSQFQGLQVPDRDSSSQCTHQVCKVSAPAQCFPLHREQHAQMHTHASQQHQQ